MALSFGVGLLSFYRLEVDSHWCRNERGMLRRIKCLSLFMVYYITRENILNNTSSGADLSTQKALVIITDGEPTDYDDLNALNRCEEQNILRYIIGVSFLKAQACQFHVQSHCKSVTVWFLRVETLWLCDAFTTLVCLSCLTCELLKQTPEFGAGISGWLTNGKLGECSRNLSGNSHYVCNLASPVVQKMTYFSFKWQVLQALIYYRFITVCFHFSRTNIQVQ